MVEQIPADDLFWTAARYTWGELPPAEHTAFEERLAHDEAACLAVAEAVRLTVHLRAARQASRPVQVAVAQTRTSSAGHWTPALITVATLAVATVWFAMQQAAPPSAVDLASSELISRWTNAGSLHEADGWDEFDVDDDVLDESLSPPGWLMQAVELANDSEMRTP